LLHERSQILCCLSSPKGNDPALEELPVLVLLAIEEFITLGLGHFQDSASFALALPFLGPGVDGLSGNFRDGGGIAGIGHLMGIAHDNGNQDCKLVMC
jgi:hypothetical protein